MKEEMLSGLDLCLTKGTKRSEQKWDGKTTKYWWLSIGKNYKKIVIHLDNVASHRKKKQNDYYHIQKIVKRNISGRRMQHNVADGTVYCAQEGLHDLSFFWNNWAGERHRSLKEASKPSCFLNFFPKQFSCRKLQNFASCGQLHLSQIQVYTNVLCMQK